MRIAVIGTGTVGQTVGSRLVGLGHQVVMGSRTRDNERAAQWVTSSGEGTGQGTFADAASFGEMVVNATTGAASLDALTAAGPENLAGKVLLDIANPLDFSHGMPPSLTVCNTDSLGEQIQRSFPQARVVKSLNTMNARVMVDPASVAGPHDVFLSGNDADAKVQVRELLREFGWPDDSIVDLGDITTARGVEMYLPLWLRLYGVVGNAPFNIRVAR